MDPSCPDQGTDAAKQLSEAVESTSSRNLQSPENSSAKRDVKGDTSCSEQKNSKILNLPTLPSSANSGDTPECAKGDNSDGRKSAGQPTYSSEHLLPLLSHSQPSSPTELFPSSPPGNGGNDGETGAPGTVRRPMNGFLIFCKRHRATVREANPELDNRSITRVLGDLWSKLGPEKATYTNLAKQKKEAFLKANPNFKWSGDRVQTGTTRSSRKSESAGIVKSHEDAAARGAMPRPNSEGPSPDAAEKKMLVPQPSTVSCPVPGSSSGPLRQTSTMTDKGRGEQRQHNALLQLAEMCSSEATMKSATESDSPALVSTAQSPSQPSPVTSPGAAHPGYALSNLGPLKKRAKHWGKPDDSSGACANDSKQETVLDKAVYLDPHASRKVEDHASKPGSGVLVNGLGAFGNGDPRRYEEFQPTLRDGPAVLKFAIGRAEDTGGNMSHLRELPKVYSHPSTGLYEARGANSSHDGDPLNLSLSRTQEPTGADHVSREERITAPDPPQRLSEMIYTPATAGATRTSFGETYASVEWYKSANHRYRKVSSSATESIPCLSPPPPHHPADEGGLDLAGSGQAPTMPSGRWHQRGVNNEKYNPTHPDSECMDPKFFQMTDKRTKLPTIEIPGRHLSNSPNFSGPTSDYSITPATSIIARMMMQQPGEPDRLTIAGSEYLLSSGSPTVASGKIQAHPLQQDQTWPASSRPDKLSKVLASTVTTKSVYDRASPQNLNPDFHQWRDPQGTIPKLSREESQTSSPTTAPLSAPAPFVARHQLPLAMQIPASNPLLSTAKSAAFSAVNSPSLPPAGLLSLATPKSCDSSVILSSQDRLVPNPTVHRQADVTTVSLESQAPRRDAKETLDLTVASHPALDKTKLNLNTGSYGEGKLKKKWAQRMLVEEKMEEDRLLSLQASEESKKALGAVEHNSWLSSKLAHTLTDNNAEHFVKTVAPSAKLTLDDSPSGMVPRYHEAYPAGKASNNHGSAFESSPAAWSGLNSQTPHDGGVKLGSTPASTSIIFSMHNSIPSNTPVNNSAQKNVLSLGGSSGTLMTRPPFSGPGVTTAGSSILSTCLMAKQPLTTVKSSVASQPRSFNASSHPKLMLQLSKGTQPPPALFAGTSTSLSIPTTAAAAAAITGAPSSSSPFQPLASSVVPNYREKTNDPVSPASSSSSGVFSSSPLLPFTSNSLLLPSTSSSPLLVISSNVGQPSDTLKVDLGAGGWRAKTSPTLGNDRSERLGILKDAPVSKLTLTPPAGADVLKFLPSASKPSEPAFSGPLTGGVKKKGQKSEKPSTRKGPKGPRKSAKNGNSMEGGKDVPSQDSGLPQSGANTTRGKRKKKEAVPQSGEETSGDKPKAKRGRRKAAKKEEQPSPPAVLQTKDTPAIESHSNLLDKMRILNPIAACGKKIVDHIVEQFVKSSDFDDEYPDKPDPFVLESSLHSRGNGSLFFARPSDGLKPSSTVDNIVMKTLAGGDRLKPQGKFPMDMKPDIDQVSERSADGKFVWRSVKEELDVKQESAQFGGPLDHSHKQKREEDVFKPQLKLFGDGEQGKRVKSDEGRQTGWSSKLFRGPEAPSLSVPVHVKQEDSREKVFGGSRAWMGEADGRERNLFPACSLVERVVREVCGSSPEKRNCFTCQRKEDLPGFSKPVQSGESSLTKMQDLMLGKAPVLSHNFPSPATQVNQQSSVWNTYRQNNDSPTNDELEKKPQLAAGSVPSTAPATTSFPTHSGFLQGYEHWKSMDMGVDAHGKTDGRNGSQAGQCLSMGDLIEHHLQQQEAEDQQRRNLGQTHQGEEEDEEEEEGQLQSRPVRKSRRANRGQKYQELIKEGFIQPSRDRVARGSSSQDDPVADLSVEQRKALKRRASERDILAAPPSLPVGDLSRSSSVSSLSRTSTRKSSFELEKEAEDEFTFETSLDKKRKQTGNSASGRLRGDYSQDARPTPASGDSADIKGAVKPTDSTQLEVPKTTATAPTVTGSRKRKARKHCITRISVVGQAQGSDSSGSGASKPSLNGGKDAKAGPGQKNQGNGSGDAKPMSAAPGSVLISPACKDLISSPTETPATARPVKPLSSGASANVPAENLVQAKLWQEDQKLYGDKKNGAGGLVLAGNTITPQDNFPTALHQQGDPDNPPTSGSKIASHKSPNLAAKPVTKCMESKDKKEICDVYSKKGSISQDYSVKSANLSKDSVHSAAATSVQPKASSVLDPSKNFPMVSPQDKLKKPKNAETPKPKKASKLRKALLSGEPEMNKSGSAALDSGSYGNADVKDIAPVSKGKRVKSENDKSKSPPVKKPRKKAGDSEGGQAPKGKKSKSVKGSENSNEAVSKKRAPKKKPAPSIAQSLPVQASSSSLVMSTPVTSCLIGQGTSRPGDQVNCQRNVQAASTPKPKSAILSAILASAPMVDRPTIGLGGTYLGQKPLDLMSAPGLKTLGGFSGFTGSPKSPGQADTAESGRPAGINQFSSTPSGVTSGGISSNTSSCLSQKGLSASPQKTSIGKNQTHNMSKFVPNSSTMSRLEQTSNSSTARHSPIHLGAVTTLSLPTSTLQSSKSSTIVGVASSTPSSSWAAGSALFMKTSPPISVTATSTAQSVRGSPALPVAASSDASQ